VVSLHDRDAFQRLTPHTALLSSKFLGELSPLKNVQTIVRLSTVIAMFFVLLDQYASVGMNDKPSIQFSNWFQALIQAQVTIGNAQASCTALESSTSTFREEVPLLNVFRCSSIGVAVEQDPNVSLHVFWKYHSILHTSDLHP
jgi:hypothetical protein